jgi:hypothetical protein
MLTGQCVCGTVEVHPYVHRCVGWREGEGKRHQDLSWSQHLTREGKTGLIMYNMGSMAQDLKNEI